MAPAGGAYLGLGASRDSLGGRLPGDEGTPWGLGCSPIAGSTVHWPWDRPAHLSEEREAEAWEV